VHVYQTLAAGLTAPLWGLRAPGLESGEEPSTDLNQMAVDFLRLIRQVVPKGPLRLLGYSFGASLAQAMATLDEVETLVLVDGAAPHDGPVTDELVLRLMGEAFGRRGVSGRVELADFLRAQEIFPEAEVHPQLERLQRVVRAHMRAWTGHVPRPWGGSAWLLRSAEGPPGDTSAPDLGWQRYLDRLQVVELGGEHRTILRSAVATLQRILE
jgi:thioesterase domain-containing protein